MVGWGHRIQQTEHIMKKQLFFILLIFLLSPLSIVTAEELDIWIITDLHHLSPLLHDKNGKAITHIRNTGAGKDFDYGEARMQALIYQIKEEQPDLLIISGDLTLNGEYQSMVDLANYFQEIERLNTEVLVIPGNHDISSGWAREFEGETFHRTRQVLPDDFTEIFSDYGYQEAFYKDPNTLSYITEINPTTWIMMIDSNIYSKKEGEGAPITSGKLTDDTLKWIAQHLATAKERNIHVLPVIHHNAITHYQRLEKNYTVGSASQLQQLMIDYRLPLTLSGHIHTQHYMSYTQNHHTFYDIVTGAFSSYPSYVGKLQVNEQSLHYSAHPLDVEGWANETGQSDPNLIHYQNYMEELFNISSRQMAFREMIESGWYDENNLILEEVADYIAQANLSFFAGTPFKPETHFSKTKISEIKQLIQNNAISFFKEYIQTIEENTTDYTQLNNLSW